ncbi:hypothetical protein QUA56_23215 [Microcoleus sp. N3A4]|uniref:hypothetical protein n=1 Tax=Microcoleus sp. N3A4 TaxID=3055379 RepID=UPI002FCF2518
MSSISFVGVSKSRLIEVKSRSPFGYFRERAIGFFISRCEFLRIMQHPAEILR